MSDFTYQEGTALTWAQMNENLRLMQAKYLDSANSAAIAVAAANFKGNWTALTGALAVPAAVYHSSKFWLLLSNLADVTAKVPGVDAEWLEIITGNVMGPAGATAGNLATLDATGKVLSDGGMAPAALMPKAGGTFTGDVTVPSINGGQLAGLRNKIVNGKMVVAQRGTSFVSPASNTYNLDRWVLGIAGTGAVTVSQQSDAPSDNEFQNSLRIAVTTADASIAAGDLLFLTQRIEGYNARDLIGRTFTVSFWVRSSKTGVHCVAFRNSGLDRSYVLEYTVNAANTWEKKSVTLSGGLITAGTWDWTTGVGLSVFFAAAIGSTFQTTAGAWQTGNFQATANQVNCLDTIGNIFSITGVQLEVGSVATPFEHRPYGMELALCQRYYWRHSSGNYFPNSAWAYTTTNFYSNIIFPVPMRIGPTALEQSGVASDYRFAHGNTTTNCSVVPTLAVVNTQTALLVGTVASGLTVGQGGLFGATTSAGYLGFSAEL